MVKFCEICGKRRTEKRCIVEGVALWVCGKCAVLGREVSYPRHVDQAGVPRHGGVYKRPGFAKPTEVVSRVDPNFAKLVRRARESKGFTQGDVAKKTNIKESFIARIEQDRASPDLDTAGKLERCLGITLVMLESAGAVEDLQEKKAETGRGAGLTLGDVLKIKTGGKKEDSE